MEPGFYWSSGFAVDEGDNDHDCFLVHKCRGPILTSVANIEPQAGL